MNWHSGLEPKCSPVNKLPISPEGLMAKLRPSMKAFLAYRIASNWLLNSALDELSGPLRIWIHHPSEGKGHLREAYEQLSPQEKHALKRDVKEAVLRVHGRDPFLAYRRLKEGDQETLSGLTSLTTDISQVQYLNPKFFRTYKVFSSDVLIHWAQDTPLGKGAFRHERELILKPNARLFPILRRKI